MHGGILHWQRQGVAIRKSGPASQYALLWICNTAPKLRLLPYTGNEEVLQDGHWLGLLPIIRLQLALCHLRRDWYGLAWFYGLPGSAQSVPFCSPGMALADASVAGPCSHLSGPESFPDLRSSPASLQEAQLTAVLGVALLREASVSPFGSCFFYYVLLRDRRR